MKPKLRKFILELPGPISYCDCNSLCSKPEIEHVYPKMLLRKKLSGKLFISANKDPHNLFKSCSQINRKKGCLLLGDGFDAYEFNGMLARSCLYMNYTYSLETDKTIILRWRNFSLLYPPLHFEYERSHMIKESFNHSNPFIDLYKD